MCRIALHLKTSPIMSYIHTSSSQFSAMILLIGLLASLHYKNLNLYSKRKYIKNKTWMNEQFTDNCWLQIEQESSRYVFSCISFTKESTKGVVAAWISKIAWHLSVGGDAVFEAIKLPTSIANLDSSLADVDRDAFALKNYQSTLLKGYLFGYRGANTGKISTFS